MEPIGKPLRMTNGTISQTQDFVYSNKIQSHHQFQMLWFQALNAFKGKKAGEKRIHYRPSNSVQLPDGLSCFHFTGSFHSYRARLKLGSQKHRGRNLFQCSQHQYTGRWLFLGSDWLQNSSHFWPKPLVKHCVCFIQYDILYIPKIKISLFSMLSDLQRSSNQNVQRFWQIGCLCAWCATWILHRILAPCWISCLFIKLIILWQILPLVF